MQKRVLDDYVSSFGDNSGSVLKRFDASLIDYSLNTRKAYNTDIWIFLRDKLFCFWDFHVMYNPVAQNLALVHTLDLVDQKISHGIMQERDGRELLEEALARTTKLLPSPESSPKKSRALVRKQIPFELLGKDFSCQYYGKNADRFKMRLRAVDSVDDVVRIRREDKVMLDFVFGKYGDYLDKEFWGDVFKEDKIGEVLQQEEKRGVSKNTLARRMISLKRFETFLYKSKKLTERVMIDMRIPSVRPKLQVCLDDDELSGLIKYAEIEYKISQGKEKLLAARNRAMIGVLIGTLVRGGALCGSKVEDLDLEKKELYVREKGRKELVVPLQAKAFRYVWDYVANYRESFMQEFGVGEENKKYIFHTSRGLVMNYRSLSRIINDYAKASGIKKNIGGRTCVGSHAIRRSCADSMSQKGARIEDIRDVMGHRSVSTTERYLMGLRNVTSSVRKTIDKYHEAVK